MPSEGQRKRDEDNPMQDLIQEYASDLKKLHQAFNKELTATADELSKAMGVYAHRSEAALASFYGESFCSWVGTGSVSDGEAQSVLRKWQSARASMTYRSR